MTEQKRRIFRQQAIDRLSNPEQLDKLMQVVSLKDWLPLSALAIFGILGGLWSIFGKIPITVTGKGVLINPGQVVQLQSPITGQLQSLNIRSGQCVKKNDILGIIYPTDKNQQLQQQRDKLAQLQQQVRKTTLVRQQRTQLETAAITAQRTTLQQRLQDTQKLTPRIKEEGLNSISQQRLSLQQKLKDTEELTPILQQRLQTQRELRTQGSISQEQVLQAEKEYRQTRRSISETQAQLQQLRLQETELQQKYQENLNNINQIRAELEKLDIQSKQLEQNNLEVTNTENNQIQEVQQGIARLQNEVKYNSTIKSLYAGCIVEITATGGQYLNPGSRLGTLQIAGETKEMMSVTYFAVEDGKKIRPGMEILITPDTVKRTRFGGIVGKVTKISSFPITSEGANSVVGNPEVVKKLMGEKGGRIEATAQLELDSKTTSGYKWSSSAGSQLEISSGTTTTVRVTVEERKPITFVLPILTELVTS